MGLLVRARDVPGAHATREETYEHARHTPQLQRLTREAIEQRRYAHGRSAI
jgi:hypothetical protein